MNIMNSYCFAEVLDYLPFRSMLNVLVLNKEYRALFMTRFKSNIANRKENLFKECLLSLGVTKTIRHLKPIVLSAFINHYKGFAVPMKILTCTYTCISNDIAIIGVMIMNTFWQILVNIPENTVKCVNRPLYKSLKK